MSSVSSQLKIINTEQCSVKQYYDDVSMILLINGSVKSLLSVCLRDFSAFICSFIGLNSNVTVM